MRFLLLTSVAVLGTHAACDPCDQTPVQIARLAGMSDATFSATEYGGHAYVAWSHWSRGLGGPSGTYLTAVDAGTVRISDTAASVAVGGTEHGLLVCWEAYEITRCALFDAALRIVRPPHVVDLTNVTHIVEFRGQLYAEIGEDGSIFSSHEYIPIEPDGTRSDGARVGVSCRSGFGRAPKGTTRLACLSDNYDDESETCMGSDGAKAPCEVRAAVQERDGSWLPVLVGEGRWPIAAARGDDILVSWTGCDGTCTRVIRADGTLGPTHSSMRSPWSLYARDGGFIAVSPSSTATGETPGDFRYPEDRSSLVWRYDRDGAPVGEPELIASDAPSQYYDAVDFVPTEDGVTAVWSVYDAETNTRNIQARAICND